MTVSLSIDGKKVDAALEVPFEPQEVFFSRTDKRGVIQYGNTVFQRLSGYEWDKLLGAPHKIVRHHDMPKAVFHILWDGIKSGKSIGAYIKNKSEDGRFYWVYALVTPIEGGYLSVRIKPQTELFEKIEKEYQELRSEEKEEELSAEASAERLVERLGKMGYRDYLHFSAVAALQELTAHSDIVGKPLHTDLKRLSTILEAVANVKRISQKIEVSCQQVDVLPVNMQIDSAALGSIAATIGIIASDCNQRTRELMQQMTSLITATEKATMSVHIGMMKACSNNALSNVIDLLEEEKEVECLPPKSEEEALVATAIQKAESDLGEQIHRVNEEIKLFSSSASLINKTIIGLNVTRIMCSIESGILGDNANNISSIVSDLQAFQDDVPGMLQEMEHNIEKMKTNIAPMMHAARNVELELGIG